MSDGPAPPRQAGCGVVNLVPPVVMVAGAVLGWYIGRPYGLVFAGLGSVAGFILSIPLFGLSVLSVAAPWPSWAGWRRVGRDQPRVHREGRRTTAKGPPRGSPGKVRPSTPREIEPTRHTYPAMKDELESLRGELDRVESRVMPFGTYQGMRISDVVRMQPSYLLWVIQNVPLRPPLREGIVRALRAYKPPKWRPGDPPPGRAKGKPMEPPADLGRAHLRVARPTDDLDAVTRFYRDGLGFKVLGEFKDHEGFDGVMLGHSGAGYHLEFTHKHGHEAGRAPTDDNLLIFYLPDREEWERAVRRMEALGYRPVKSLNPFWDRAGKTFSDPDGYRVVLQNAAWRA